MKRNQVFLIAVVVIFITLTFVMNASAAWYTCSINLVGSTSSKPAIRLTDTASSPAFTSNWFFIAGDKSKEMLATALTAMSMGKNVLVNAQGTSAFDDITGIYIVP